MISRFIATFALEKFKVALNPLHFITDSFNPHANLKFKIPINCLLFLLASVTFSVRVHKLKRQKSSKLNCNDIIAPNGWLKNTMPLNYLKKQHGIKPKQSKLGWHAHIFLDIEQERKNCFKCKQSLHQL